MTGALPPGEQPRERTAMPDGGLPHDDPPTSVADGLEQAARWLDSFDRFYRTLLTDHGVNPERTPVGDDEVQQFLRNLARWFTERPVLAKVAWDDVRAGP